MTNTTNVRVNLLTQRLQEALAPENLTVIDDSAAHAGHSGAQESGGGHFSIEVTSSMFNDKSAIERHRMIYVALGDAMGTAIHAVSINALTPEEATAQQDH
jgi:BolA family transcriptional regulator, general stress-responsive regulator